MLSLLKTKGAFDTFTSKSIIIPKGGKPQHVYQKEDNLQDRLQREATVLGTIQIMCCLVISSVGATLVSAPHSPRFSPAVSTILMSGYPFLGALCFAITGSLSIISGKKSTKPFAMSSLTSNAVSSVAAGAGLLFLMDSLVALGTASQQCDSEKDYLSSLLYSEYYYSTVKDCLLTSASLTGALAVMLIFTVLELLLSAYASILWWKQVYSNNPGCAFSLSQS
ncbi:membrane-spanning 4-domains subfamily A member 7 isoform X2 [Phacochoerus africanus]|uniref:membrane-spanning 4-domains subfamily A member 7 isoform X2 n=1 Tax=Phacochoerus africanus TaxID=41426 RepID=UPI001FD8F8A9|nr:membrane-spanning 4-domains subfamily A member 7 isoform X2 [Phacochoerus africanus]